MHFIIVILSSEIMSTTGFIVSKLRTYQEAAFESDSWKSVTAFASHQSEVNIFCFMTVSWFTRLCFNNPIISKWVDSFSPFWCLISTVVKWPVSPMHWKQCTRNSDYLSTFEHPHSVSLRVVFHWHFFLESCWSSCFWTWLLQVWHSMYVVNVSVLGWVFLRCTHSPLT